jgi:hypothetical protein
MPMIWYAAACRGRKRYGARDWSLAAWKIPQLKLALEGRMTEHHRGA